MNINLTEFDKELANLIKSIKEMNKELKALGEVVTRLAGSVGYDGDEKYANLSPADDVFDQTKGE